MSKKQTQQTIVNTLPKARAYLLVDKATNKPSSYAIFSTRQEAREWKDADQRIVQLTPEKFVR